MGRVSTLERRELSGRGIRIGCVPEIVCIGIRFAWTGEFNGNFVRLIHSARHGQTKENVRIELIDRSVDIKQKTAEGKKFVRLAS